MKIRFTKKQFNYYLVFGILWLILGISLLTFESGNFFRLGYLTIGVLYLGGYIFMKNRQYLTIKDGVITKNNLIPKKINLVEITKIKRFAGDYILKTNNNELTINTQLIDKKSLADLDTVLEKLDVEWV